MEPDYPLTFSVDYPERKLSRLTTFFRIFTVIPIAILAGLLSGGGGVILPVVLMLLFRQKYPRWWFDWNRELTRFGNRIVVYLALMDDSYPSTDEEQSVHLNFEYPNAEELSRGLPLVKWLLAIPHYIVLFFLVIVAYLFVIIAWFAILFTGSYPRGLFNFVEGVFRWYNRVNAYAFLLITDRYPPFSLE
jgi:hypothetical protein